MTKFIPKYKKFIFEGYTFDTDKKLLELRYSYDSILKYKETYIFDFEFDDSYSKTALNEAIFALFVMAGISYYKSYLAPEIVMPKFSMSKDQAEFFNEIYRNGLGEFLYINKLHPSQIATFDYTIENRPKASKASNLSGSLLAIGGGKDSLTSAMILDKIGEDFTSIRVNTNPWIDKQLSTIGHDAILVKRILDPAITDGTASNALNGHIPPTAILSFVFVLCAILTGKKNIIMSNEASANRGSTMYEGVEINHQYSKSLDFEILFQAYVSRHINPSINYFSLLRPFNELRITELFYTHSFKKYANIFSSCNRNFKLNHKSVEAFWCGECSKCASVFGMFIAFMSRDEVIELFGKNLFEDEKLRKTYDELIGANGIKPFDCVGDIDEMQNALVIARNNDSWPELHNFELPEFLNSLPAMYVHAMPKSFFEKLKSNLYIKSD